MAASLIVGTVASLLLLGLLTLLSGLIADRWALIVAALTDDAVRTPRWLPQRSAA